MANLSSSTLEAGTELNHTAMILGVTSDELQQFHMAAEMGHTSVEAIDTSLRFLNRTLGEGGANAAKISALGIALKDTSGKAKPAKDIFIELADKIAAMNDPAKATALAMEVLGRGGAQVLPMLKQGGDKLKESFAELEKSGGGFTEEFIAGAEEAERAQVKWDMSTRSLKVAFVNGLLPAITAIVDWGTKAARAIGEWEKRTGGLKTAALFLTGGSFVFALTRISSILKTLGLDVQTIGKSFGKFAAYTALITALYYVFDDLFGLFTGKDSEIGAIIDELYGKGASTEFVEKMKTAWGEIKTAVAAARPVIEAIVKFMIEQIPPAIKALIKAGDVIASTFGSIVGAVAAPVFAGENAQLNDEARERAGKKWEPGEFERNKKQASELGKNANPFYSWEDAAKGQDAKLNAEAKARAAAEVDSGARPGTGTGIRQEINIHFHGDVSPEKAKKAVTDGVGRANRDAYGAVAQ